MMTIKKRRDYKNVRDIKFQDFFIVTVVATVPLTSNGIVVAQPVSASTGDSFKEGWCCNNGRVFPARMSQN
jgi:hypothetical protein